MNCFNFYQLKCNLDEECLLGKMSKIISLNVAFFIISIGKYIQNR